MKWGAAPLEVVAPAQASDLRFGPDEVVWHLTLDQVEAHTGRILEKLRRPFAEAGTSTFVFDDRNVLYSKLRPYLNKVVCPTEPGVATTELVPLRPDPRILDRNFLAYYLRSQRFLAFASSTVAGVKMPRVIMSKLREHEVPLPPISEQRRIVEILDQADALRKKRAEADAKAARILPALFYKMFGDPATNPKGWPMKALSALGAAAADARIGVILLDDRLRFSAATRYWLLSEYTGPEPEQPVPTAPSVLSAINFAASLKRCCRDARRLRLHANPGCSLSEYVVLMAMSKRLQVLLPEQEMKEIQRLARLDRLTVGEWVRRVLREARAQKPSSGPEAKLAAVRRSVEYSFPTADMEQMLREIEQGYRA